MVGSKTAGSEQDRYPSPIRTATSPTNMQVVPRLQRSFLNSFCQRRALHELLTSSPRKTLFVNPNPDPQRSRRGASLRSQRAFTSSSTLRESKKTEEPVDTGKSSELSTPKSGASLRENIYTIPNVLTVSRIVACPVLGWAVLEGNYEVATGLLVYAGLSDLVCVPLTRFFSRSDPFREGRRSFGSKIQHGISPRHHSRSCSG